MRTVQQEQGGGSRNLAARGDLNAWIGKVLPIGEINSKTTGLLDEANTETLGTPTLPARRSTGPPCETPSSQRRLHHDLVKRVFHDPLSPGLFEARDDDSHR